jgi:predicted RNase H-like HicB family nuclease
MELTAVYERDGDRIMGYVVEIPGVNIQGRALEECRDSLQDALREFVAARREQAAGGDHTYRIAEERTRLEEVASPGALCSGTWSRLRTDLVSLQGPQCPAGLRV